MENDANLATRVAALEADITALVDAAVTLIAGLGALNAEVDGVVDGGDAGALRARIEALEKDLDALYARIVRRWPGSG